METAIRDVASAATLQISMFGPLRLSRNEVPQDLPASRKVRALLAYLSLASRPVGRSRLCDLLGDVPDDPKGELRWCLSKLRAVLDEPGHRRVIARDDMISLDLDACAADALEIQKAFTDGIEQLSHDTLRRLCDLFAGDFIEGLSLARSPQLEHWIGIQRRHFRECHGVLLQQLVRILSRDPPTRRIYAERHASLAPLNMQAQISLLRTLVECDRVPEAEEHLAATEHLFAAEHLDAGPIRQVWRDLRKLGSVLPSPIEIIPLVPGAGSLALDRTLDTAGRASLAVMPFNLAETVNPQAQLAEGLTHDIITRLAKLRCLFLIASGSVFALAERGVSPEEAARLLNVDYFVTGLVKSWTTRIIVMVELIATQTLHIVWSDEFDLKRDDTFLVLDEIGDRIVASVANEIEAAEKNRAILKPPNSLNAWGAYHRGLWHMHRFTKPDNDLAQHYFQQSMASDPTFARAYAALSFTHWQNAFQRWADREREADLAFEAAGQSLIADDHDPAAHWAMGRALWLRSSQDQAVAELERAVHLSPNFALGHYALSFVHSQSGDPSAAIASSDHSRSLSPFDPLLFGMLGARALAHVRLGQFAEAATWATKAAARPNAHVIILAIAAHCLALAGKLDEGRAVAATIRKSLPDFSVDDFLSTFKFPPETEAMFRKAATYLSG